MLDTLAEAWAADNGGANIWADKTVRFLDPCTKSGVFLREITSRLTKGLADEIPDLEKRVESHPDEAGVRHRHHASHQPAGAPERVLLEARQGQALHRQVLRQRRWQHLVRAHRAHVGWMASASTAAPARTRLRPWRRARNPRLCVHSHRRHQDSAGRVVWRRYAVRRDHRQPAVPAGRAEAVGTSDCADLPAVR